MYHMVFPAKYRRKVFTSEVEKSLTAREIFRRHPKIKRQILWGGALCISGYSPNTVGLYAGKDTIRRYIENQWKQEEFPSNTYEQTQRSIYE